MAFSIKGKGKKVAVSLVIVAVLMMLCGSIAAGLFGGRWHEWVIVGISCGYSVWLATLLFKDVDKPEGPAEG